MKEGGKCLRSETTCYIKTTPVIFSNQIRRKVLAKSHCNIINMDLPGLQPISAEERARRSVFGRLYLSSYLVIHVVLQQLG